MKNKSWYTISAKKNSNAEIMIYEEIGIWGISAKDFIKDLNALDVEKISLRLNTPGGSVFEGNAIYNALVRHKAKVTTYIDGLAASMGSIIALAGDEIHIADNGFYMIHNPSGFAFGDSEAMRERANLLDKLAEAMVRIYVDKTDLSEDEIIQAMNDETWYSASEAKENGFVDVIDEEIQVAAHTNLDRFNYANAPDLSSSLDEVVLNENIARKIAARRTSIMEFEE